MTTTYTPTGGANLVSVVADESDTSYAKSVSVPNEETITYAINPLASGSPVALKIRGAIDTAGFHIDRTIRLLQGTHVIAARTYTLTSTTPSDYIFTTTNSETAGITDYTNLSIAITDTQTDGYGMGGYGENGYGQ